MAILYKPMDSSHVEGVFELSKNSFHIPWSLESIQQELTNNLARYIVAMDSDSNKVIGFAGMWIIAGEGNITNIAVDADFKRVGIVYNLLSALFDICKKENCPDITLEVRVSNIAAQKLYEKAGFINEGIRKKYYEDNGEDAMIMWKRNII